jgi:transposase
MEPTMPKNGRMKLRDFKKIIHLHQNTHLSLREIASVLKTPKSTVADYLSRFKKSGKTLSDLESLSDDEIYAFHFPEESKRPKQQLRKMLPNFEQMDLELKKKYVARELLWEEYKQRFPGAHYEYTHFCNLYRAWKKRVSISKRVSHKAGEKMFIDYSGLRWYIVDRDTGEAQDVDIFVSVLGASGMTYSEASMDQTTPSVIASLIRAFEYYGGLPELVVPDHMKTIVTKADNYEPVIKGTFLDMGDHYGVIFLPTRPYRAKDKAKVELTVKLVQRWILARLRHTTFFTLAELNQAIAELLVIFNNKVVKRYDKSRYQLLLELDKPALKPLPMQRYSYREFKQCRVNIDYHVELEGCFYSVPYQLGGETVSAIYTVDSIELFHNNKRVALHVRLYKKGSYSTHKKDMASSHRHYGTWSPSHRINWGANFGDYTKRLIEHILAVRPHPEKDFRTYRTFPEKVRPNARSKPSIGRFFICLRQAPNRQSRLLLTSKPTGRIEKYFWLREVHFQVPQGVAFGVRTDSPLKPHSSQIFY